MTKAVHTIGPNQTLRECAEILKKCHVNGLVVAKDGKIEGEEMERWMDEAFRRPFSLFGPTKIMIE